MPPPKWRSPEGRAEFHKLLESTKYTFDGNWNDWPSIVRASRGPKSKIPLRCRVCKLRCAVQMSNFVLRKTAQCLCSKRRGWKEEGGLKRLDEIVQHSRFVWEFVPNEAELDYYLRLPLRCTKCGESSSPILVDFINGKAACACHNTTELKVKRLIEAVVDNRAEFTICTHVGGDGLVGVKGGRLTFDIAVYDDQGPACFVEVDGGHHFDPTFRYRKMVASRAAESMEHDIRKEVYAASQGVPMLRLDTDVVRKNKMTWNGWLQGRVTACLEGNLGPGIHRLGPSYATGPYALMRVGNQLIANTEYGPVVDPNLAMRVF